MSKDPSFLLYTGDFIVGTMFMSNEDVGIYIRLLCAQHQHGGMIPKDTFNTTVNSHDKVRAKFTETEDGFYNNRLMEEMIRRQKKSTNLSANAFKRWEKDKQMQCKSNANAPTDVMPTEDENEDRDKDKNLKEIFDKFRKVYPGRKRGLDVEFDNLKKCCKKYKLKISDIIPLLEPAIETTKKNNNIKLKRNLFVAEWKHLETWINKQCWTEEEIIEDEENLY